MMFHLEMLPAIRIPDDPILEWRPLLVGLFCVRNFAAAVENEKTLTGVSAMLSVMAKC